MHVLVKFNEYFHREVLLKRHYVSHPPLCSVGQRYPQPLSHLPTSGVRPHLCLCDTYSFTCFVLRGASNHAVSYIHDGPGKSALWTGCNATGLTVETKPSRCDFLLLLWSPVLNSQPPLSPRWSAATTSSRPAWRPPRGRSLWTAVWSSSCSPIQPMTEDSGTCWLTSLVSSHPLL